MKLDNASDDRLIQIFKEDGTGKERAFSILFARYNHAITKTIYSVLHNEQEAQDIAQNTWIKIQEAIQNDRYKPQTKFAPWANRIAKNAAIDMFRKQKRKPPIQSLEDETGPATFSNMESSIMSREDVEKLQHLVNQLPEDQKKVVDLRISNNLSYQHISRITNTSINTCLGRFRYALRNLKRLNHDKPRKN